MMEILAKVSSKSNFTLKWDNAPADYGSLFDVSEVISAFDFAVGTLPLSVVVRNLRFFIKRKKYVYGTIHYHR